MVKEEADSRGRWCPKRLSQFSVESSTQRVSKWRSERASARPRVSVIDLGGGVNSED